MTQMAFDTRRKAAIEVGLPEYSSWVVINKKSVEIKKLTILI
jgi:hypothetical protein